LTKTIEDKTPSEALLELNSTDGASHEWSPYHKITEDYTPLSILEKYKDN
jgi:hypothetical protein